MLNQKLKRGQQNHLRPGLCANHARNFTGQERTRFLVESAIAKEIKQRLLMSGRRLFVIRARLDVRLAYFQSRGNKVQVSRTKLFAKEFVAGTKVSRRENEAGLIGGGAEALAQLLEMGRKGEELFALQVIEERRRFKSLNLRRVENLYGRHSLVFPTRTDEPENVRLFDNEN